MSIEALDRVYIEAPLLDIPKRAMRGVVLHRLHNEGTRLQPYRFFEWVGFEAMPWGIDFTKDDWFFFAPVIGMGRFNAEARDSRWRDTRSFGLNYAVSDLPKWITRELYDEVKPLSGSLCLGLGGINRARGLGDHFYFALSPVR